MAYFLLQNIKEGILKNIGIQKVWLPLYGQTPRLFSKYLLLRSTEENKPCRFGMT